VPIIFGRKHWSRLTNQSMPCLLQSLLCPQFLSKSIQIHDHVGVNALVLVPTNYAPTIAPLHFEAEGEDQVLAEGAI